MAFLQKLNAWYMGGRCFMCILTLNVQDKNKLKILLELS